MRLIDEQQAIDALMERFKRVPTTAIIAKDTIENLPSAKPGQRWIPCNERLPDYGGRYLISVLDGIDRKTTVAPYLPRCKAWTMTGRRAYWKVIAWMPLPEPYAERRTDE